MADLVPDTATIIADLRKLSRGAETGNGSTSSSTPELDVEFYLM